MMLCSPVLCHRHGRHLIYLAGWLAGRSESLSLSYPIEAAIEWQEEPVAAAGR